MADDADLRAIAARLDYIEESLAYLGRAVGRSYTPYRLAQGEPAFADLSAAPPAGLGGTAAPAMAVPPELVAMARAGKLIQAIKQYKDMTGLQLKDARDAIEQAAARGC